MKYIAYTTKGLEEITQQEIQNLSDDVAVLKVGTKRVIFETDISFKQLIYLKTVDDLGILIGEINALNDLDQLISEVQNIDIKSVKNLINEFRNIENTFSITTSIAKTKFDTKKLQEIISQQISEKYHWQFNEFDHSNFDIRIFIDQNECLISIRLTNQPLQNRSYKTLSKLGSLKPTIAASMVRLATNQKKDLTIVDNFCGSGTILCEASLLNHQIYGGDIDPNSVITTQSNLKNTGYKKISNIKTLNATKTPWPNSYFDCAISNLPWDKQIKVESITNLYIQCLKEFQRILKPTGKLCLLISKPELLIKHIKSIFPNYNIQEIKIGLLGQNPSIVTITPNSLN